MAECFTPSGGNPVSIYLSMQRVRFSSPDAYEKFKVVFGDTRHFLMELPGFLHLTWWQHPDDPTWFNECSFWTSKQALRDWHMDTYHKHAKAWAANGAIMEDIITNFELVGTRLLRICPCCNELQDKQYELAQEQAVLREQCPKCGFHFPYLTEQPSSFAVFKDAVPTPLLDNEEDIRVAEPAGQA
jgi:heme-degrading monooxygenase HmoA/Zn ribbon nucleic-acid-binding protein